MANLPISKTVTTTSSTCSILVLPFLILFSGCGGSGMEGEFLGSIGSKKEVSIRFTGSENVDLKGYWMESLKGKHEKSSLQGKTVDSLIFKGPAEKPFKLRICYRKSDQFLEILSIHSRMIGPGARYVSTEPEATFSNGFPRLLRKK